ncbi:MAG TPA: CheR family methyltransferase [Candidatus Binatia bacterium]|jgi:chemotaxis protein methyltransferase CheR|nr:CheR family methyltransferase [Candidatus Binatia bacterium]
MARNPSRADSQARSTHGEIDERTLLSPALFSRYQQLIYQESGIWLGEHKHALLTGRLARRLRLLALNNMREYFELVTQADQQHERAMMIDCITTNQTHFFREPRHFDFLTQQVFPRWLHERTTGERSARLRIWSAGCSSGEEPYSLAMLLTKHFLAEQGWECEVLGTDICTRVLEKARAAVYAIEKAKEIPAEFLRAYMLKGRGEHKAEMKVSPELHRLVRFARVNLHGDSYPILGSFDLIFCRNVLIYFDQASKQRVIAGLLRHLSPKGLLIVGHSEHLGSISPNLRSIAPTIYSVVGNQGHTRMAATAAEPGSQMEYETW